MEEIPKINVALRNQNSPALHNLNLVLQRKIIIQIR